MSTLADPASAGYSRLLEGLPSRGRKGYQGRSPWLVGVVVEKIERGRTILMPRAKVFPPTHDGWGRPGAISRTPRAPPHAAASAFTGRVNRNVAPAQTPSAIAPSISGASATCAV
jgi:hypothetical protein